MNKNILKQTDVYYSEKIIEFGPTSRGADWNSTESQELRFHQLSRILDGESAESIFSICDYGCGYGFFSEYLKKEGYNANYTGIDLSKQMIATAQENYGSQENVNFVEGSEIRKAYDYITASGIFNVRQKIDDKEWKEYMIEILEMFNRFSEKGFSFNCLTCYSDPEYMKEYLYYADPMFYFDYAKRNFSRNVAILHDYNLYEFTMLIRK